MAGLSGKIQRATDHPSAKGTATPMTATRTADKPTLANARRSLSRPTSNSNMRTPISPRKRSVSLARTNSMPAPPATSGERLARNIPNKSSPRTDGWPKRSTINPPSLAPTTSTASPNKIGAEWEAPWGSAEADAARNPTRATEVKPCDINPFAKRAPFGSREKWPDQLGAMTMGKELFQGGCGMPRLTMSPDQAQE